MRLTYSSVSLCVLVSNFIICIYYVMQRYMIQFYKIHPKYFMICIGLIMLRFIRRRFVLRPFAWGRSLQNLICKMIAFSFMITVCTNSTKMENTCLQSIMLTLLECSDIQYNWGLIRNQIECIWILL